MPLKWKIFRLANYLLLLISIVITGLGTYFFVNSTFTSTDLFYYILFAAGGVVLISNFSFNILLLEKHYPDVEIQRPLAVVMTISLLLSCITIGFLTLIYGFEFYDTVVSPRYNRGLFNREVLFSLSFGMILLISYYVFWMQVALRKTIIRNRQKIYAAFLESKQ